MVWKRDQTVIWGLLPVPQSTENSEKKWWRNSKCFPNSKCAGRALAEAHGECHHDIPLSQAHTRQAACERQSCRRQLEPAQGTSRALPSWHQIWGRRCHELRPEAAQAETTVFPKSCPGQLYTLDLARSALTPRTNLHTAQVLLEVIWASLPSGQQAGAYQLPFHISFYFFSLLLTADRKQTRCHRGVCEWWTFVFLPTESCQIIKLHPVCKTSPGVLFFLKSMMSQKYYLKTESKITLLSAEHSGVFIGTAKIVLLCFSGTVHSQIIAWG